MQGTQRVAIVAVILAACAMSSCRGRDQKTNARQDSSVMAGVESLAVQHPAFGMNDAEVVGTLDAANAADSAGGAMAVQKGRSADVKSFGRLMMAEHHALRQQGQEVARQANLTPDTAAAARMRASHDSAAQRLGALSGAEFDRAYADHEVRAHEQVLGIVQQARKATSSEPLRNLLIQAEPVIQRHLDRARELQRGLPAS